MHGACSIFSHADGYRILKRTRPSFPSGVHTPAISSEQRTNPPRQALWYHPLDSAVSRPERFGVERQRPRYQGASHRI